MGAAPLDRYRSTGMRLVLRNSLSLLAGQDVARVLRLHVKLLVVVELQRAGQMRLAPARGQREQRVQAAPGGHGDVCISVYVRVGCVHSGV